MFDTKPPALPAFLHKRFGSALRIGLSKTGAAVVLTSGWRRTRGEILADVAEDEDAAPEAAGARLDGLLKGCPRLPARIVLCDSWARRWMVTPPQNASSLADCRAAAMARFQALFGESLSGWHLAADWNARQPFLACAVPQALLAGLHQAARARGLVLLEVSPQFVVAWNRWRADLRDDAWFGVLHRQALTFAVPGKNGPQAVREVALSGEELRDQQRVPEILAREALRLNAPMPPEIRLCGQIPAHWAMQKTGGLAFVRLGRDDPAHASLSAAAALAFTGMQS